MSFVSPEFALLCLLFFPLYWALARHVRAQQLFLTASGYALYASWSLRFAAVLLGYSAAVWALGRWIARGPRQRLALALALCLCTSFLLGVKYYEFLRESGVAALAALGLNAGLPLVDLVAPVGVSFFTFQAITYLVAAARPAAAARPFGQLALFLCFWPTLFAGPILRAEPFFAQLDALSTGRPRQGWLALYLITLGAAQKLVAASWLADTFVDPVFKYPQNYGSLALLGSMLGYALQIFLDFGGYTLIVTGLALLLGYELPVNFRQPYLARNLQDFWTRWHMSLSSFIRDYIYIPLGGNRRGFARTQAHVLVGMLVSGVWHGASWTFVLWGLLHGLGVVGVNLHKRWGFAPMAAPLAQGLTLAFVTLAWVFFRADSVDLAWVMLGGLVCNAQGFWNASGLPLLSLLAFAFAFWALSRHAARLQQRAVRWLQGAGPIVATLALSGALSAVIALGPEGVPGFIYYRF